MISLAVVPYDSWNVTDTFKPLTGSITQSLNEEELLLRCCYEPSARNYLLANHCSGKICRRPTDSFLPISFKYKICCGPTDIFLPISFGCKYAVALQYLLSPIRFKAETAAALQEQIFVFPPIRLVVKICLRFLQRRSPTRPLYEKAICKNVQKLKQANS